ncbi:hypothetical protein ES705_22008 [subsurface metagenome]
MKKALLFFFLALFSMFMAKAQKTYSVTSGEMIFSFSNVEFTDAFLADNPNAEVTKTNLRYTIFFHLGQYWHIDFTNNIGILTGLGMRNVGLISDEKIPETVGSEVMVDHKIIRRVYTLGVPLSLKIGSFKNHIYFFGGGEYELAFQYKQKYWKSHSRSGSKTKENEWFASQTPTFLPSVFGGVQLPGGINIKFKYYLTDFLNHNYSRTSSGGNFEVGDLTRYKTSQVFYFSLSWQFNTAYITKREWQTGTEVAYR